MTSYLIILSIFISVAIGYKCKINVGIIAMAFAYIFGCFVLGLKSSAVIAMWPTSLFYFILMVSFFYGIAMTNGTLMLIAENANTHVAEKPICALPVSVQKKIQKFGQVGGLTNERNDIA